MSVTTTGPTRRAAGPTSGVAGVPRRGRGTYAGDRPPTLGLVGRASGALRLFVCEDTQQTTLTPKVEAWTEPDVCLFTDASNAYDKVETTRSRRPGRDDGANAPERQPLQWGVGP